MKLHGVKLVQHVETQKVYVKKVLTIYDPRVFQYLKGHPMAGIPRIIELIETEGSLVVIEEYISGVPLRKVLDEGRSSVPGRRRAALRRCVGFWGRCIS